MIKVNEEWNQIKNLGCIPFELGSLFLECNLEYNSDNTDYFINEFPDEWDINDLEIRVLDSRISVYQGTMSRKLLKKNQGNISKSMSLNEFLKQMSLKQETIESVTRLLVYLKGDEEYD